jgi:hypothetical protein
VGGKLGATTEVGGFGTYVDRILRLVCNDPYETSWKHHPSHHSWEGPEGDNRSESGDVESQSVPPRLTRRSSFSESWIYRFVQEGCSKLTPNWREKQQEIEYMIYVCIYIYITVCKIKSREILQVSQIFPCLFVPVQPSCFLQGNESEKRKVTCTN